jgi:uncharacterized protein (TIGR03435 family)
MRALLVIAALIAPMAGQAPDAPAFEAASIKRSARGLTSATMRTLPDGQVTVSNLPLRVLLSRGWGVYSEESGLPSWMNSDHYDVVVKPAPGATPDQLQQMWRSLFAERLKFAAHLEPREVPSYALVVARSDGRLGPQLRRATVDCPPAAAQRPAAGADIWADAEKRCDLLSGSGRMTTGSAPLDQLANMLRSWAGRPVTNATRLDGRYAIDLRWSFPAQAGGPPGGTADAPEIFTAVQEQLGLKLQPSTTTVQILVIDHAERPDEN